MNNNETLHSGQQAGETRREFLRKASLLGITGLAGTISSRSKALATAATENQSGTQAKLPRFAVISDTHAGLESRGAGSAEKITRALKCLTGNNPPDALFVVGDITNNGKEAEYDEIVALFGNPENIPASVKVYYLMGNHDNHCGDMAAARFREKLKQPPHQYIILKGYPFITISMTGSRGQSYNAEAQQYLSDKLAAAARDFPGKPVFVFEHIPSMNTCYGSTPWAQDILTPILSRYPQAIVFSGHSHSSIGDPRSIHQNRFTSVNDGSITYCEQEPGDRLTVGTIPEHAGDIQEGLTVRVLPDGNVEIERHDVCRSEEILPKWLVEAPHDGTNFTYKERYPMPWFADGVRPEVRLGAQTCEVTFPQATDRELVVSYIVEIVVEDNINEAVAGQRVFSQYYLNSRKPATLTVHFSDLPSGKQLCALVAAINPSHRLSLPIKSDSFTF